MAILDYLPFTLGTYLMLSVAVVAGGFVQSSTGTAFALLIVPLLSLIEPQRIPSTSLILGGIVAIIMTFKLRKDINFSQVGWAIGGRIFGSFLVVLLLKSLQNVRELEIVIALAFLGVCAISYLPFRPTLNRKTLACAGLFSGLTGTLVAMGSGPMVLLYQHEEPAKIRSNLSAFFVGGVFFSLVFLWGGDLIHTRDWIIATSLIPWLLLGVMLGSFSWRKIKKQTVRTAIIFLTASSALLLLSKPLWQG